MYTGDGQQPGSVSSHVRVNASGNVAFDVRSCRCWCTPAAGQDQFRSALSCLFYVWRARAACGEEVAEASGSRVAVSMPLHPHHPRTDSVSLPLALS